MVSGRVRDNSSRARSTRMRALLRACCRLQAPGFKIRASGSKLAETIRVQLEAAMRECVCVCCADLASAEKLESLNANSMNGRRLVIHSNMPKLLPASLIMSLLLLQHSRIDYSHHWQSYSWLAEGRDSSDSVDRSSSSSSDNNTSYIFARLLHPISWLTSR